MGDVVYPEHLVTTLDVPVDGVLDAARKMGLKSVVVIGETESGRDSTSDSDIPTVLFWIEMVKTRLLRAAMAGETDDG